MRWLRHLFRAAPPPPAPDTSATLAQMQRSRAHVTAHTERRRREAAAVRLEQITLRRQIRELHPLETGWFAEGPERRP